ncbi:MAG: OsmC family protein [Anaerolineales bacterium]|nr:OsmC family protein [Anaerolineales bacterium]MCB9127272.1 OsmC family protein [Ardenticatenales bacterium]MCB9172561.1 OsmC family protein [Ardenticatenales bacterium]
MANQTELTWIEKQRYLGTGSDNNPVVISSGNDIGTRPVDLLLLAVSSCASVDVVEIIQKQRKRLTRLHVVASGERADAIPARFVSLHLRFEIEAEGLSAEQAERAVSLSIQKYCSVSDSLDPAMPISHQIVLNGEAV